MSEKRTIYIKCYKHFKEKNCFGKGYCKAKILAGGRGRQGGYIHFQAFYNNKKEEKKKR
jgi:hypothetical protein